MTHYEDTDQGREALRMHHEDRVELHAPQPTRLTVYVQYEPTGWYAVVTDSDSGRTIGSSRGPSSHDVLHQVALIADNATVAR